MRVAVRSARPLRFDDGAPVRSASGAAPWRDGVLVVQDDATHAAHVQRSAVSRVRVLPPVEGLELFAEAEGSKHLKPDLEAACALPDGRVLLLGSGSTDRRTRAVLLDDAPRVTDLAPVHEEVRRLLGVPEVNMEGACVVGGGVLRWFHRGVAGAASGSVDVPLEALLAAFDGAPEPPVSHPLSYDLGDGLAVTDALALPDGRVLVSAAAEDAPDAYADGPVGASALAVLNGDRVVDGVALPTVGGEVVKLEGLCDGPDALIGVVDADDPERPSLLLVLDLVLDLA